MKPPQGFALLDRPPWRGWRALELEAAEEEAILAAIEAQNGPPLKEDTTSRVWRDGPHIIKRFEPRPGLLGRRREGRARRALLNALELRRRGGATPRVLAALTRADQAGRSWLITALAPGRPLEDALAQDPSLGAELLAFLAELHERGLYHGDLKRANIFAGPESQPASFTLIDLDALRIAPLRPKRAAIRDLGMLLSSIGGYASRQQGLRAFARYRKGRRWSRLQARRALAAAADFARRRAARGSKPARGGWPP